MTSEVQSEVIHISREDLRELIREEVEAGVRRVLHEAGLSIKDDGGVAEAREDFRTLRRLRKAMDAASMTVGKAVVLTLVGGALSLVAILIKIHVLKQP